MLLLLLLGVTKEDSSPARQFFRNNPIIILSAPRVNLPHKDTASQKWFPMYVWCIWVRSDDISIHYRCHWRNNGIIFSQSDAKYKRNVIILFPISLDVYVL